MTTRNALRFLRSLADATHEWGVTTRANNSVTIDLPRTGPGLRKGHGLLTRLAVGEALKVVLGGEK